MQLKSPIFYCCFQMFCFDLFLFDQKGKIEAKLVEAFYALTEDATYCVLSVDEMSPFCYDS